MHRHKTSSVPANKKPEEAFEQYFKEHYASLCKGVNRLLKDETLSEDLVQEVFIKVWEKKDQLEFNDRFIFYLKKSCYHAALNFLSGKTWMSAVEELAIPASYGYSDNEILQDELQNQVRMAISQLPEKTRLVFTLSRYEEMTYKEISIQLGVSIKAVEKHMTIALKRLKEALKDYLVSLLLISFFLF